MSAHFFLVITSFLAVPALIGRLPVVSKVLPLVFIQLLCGVALQLSGGQAWLLHHGVDLLDGPLASSVQGIGWLGVVLLVALSSVHPKSDHQNEAPLRFVAVSVMGFGVTLLVGGLVGWGLVQAYPQLIGERGTPLLFGASVGICLAVTALPVLVAILKETGLQETRVGRLALMSALLDDLWLWLGLITVLSLAGVHSGGPLATLLPVVAFALAMAFVARPLLDGLFRKVDALHEGALLGVCVILLSAAVTDLLGVHAMLGAFIGGAILPQRAVRQWGPGISETVKWLLLPVFFVSTGLRLHIEWGDARFWTLAALFSFTAMATKMLVVACTARLGGLPWSRSFLLGTLMQCKGLMELVAINILLEARIISVEVYSALAVMALFSTFMTAPLLRLWRSRHDSQESRTADESRAG
ncbi:transporter (CPA2 family) [Roseimicrobium gellanilyticum]|uniref:Transporter (CPA2 family) n=1 Tax=Roseimicrobium gellanilyticum TaxID=748857 RepID=A0A366HXA8_9BACT|nr:cation:proton antiporter [Roseimicrobium gellanilyticum]RBP48194.1 transporter (CPA2 family) [Roseimicrobium gellanilyticum]